MKRDGFHAFLLAHRRNRTSVNANHFSHFELSMSLSLNVQRAPVLDLSYWIRKRAAVMQPASVNNFPAKLTDLIQSPSLLGEILTHGMDIRQDVGHSSMSLCIQHFRTHDIFARLLFPGRDLPPGLPPPFIFFTE